MNPPVNGLTRLSAWGGVMFGGLFFAGLVLSGFLPPASPDWSVAQVGEHFATHTLGLRIGMLFVLFSSLFYVMFTAVVAAQTRRIPGVSTTLVFAQLVGGAIAAATFLLPALIWEVAAFRPARDPVITQLLNDLAWVILIMPLPPFLAQFLSFAVAVFGDKREVPVYPRWLAYLTIWVAVIAMPAVLVPFFKTGPFAWNGLLVFWLPALALGGWLAAMCWGTLRALATAET